MPWIQAPDTLIDVNYSDREASKYLKNKVNNFLSYLLRQMKRSLSSPLIRSAPGKYDHCSEFSAWQLLSVCKKHAHLHNNIKQCVTNTATFRMNQLDLGKWTRPNGEWTLWAYTNYSQDLYTVGTLEVGGGDRCFLGCLYSLQMVYNVWQKLDTLEMTPSAEVQSIQNLAQSPLL